MIPENRLVAALDAADLDVVVASSPQNVFYLSGLESLSQDLLGERAFAVRTAAGDSHIVLPGVDASIVVDMALDYDRVVTYGSFFLYEGETVSDADREVLGMLESSDHEDPIDALLAVLEPLAGGDTRIALERGPLTADEIARVEDGIGRTEALLDAGPICADLRRVKSDEEIRRLRRSVEVNQAAIRAAVEELETGTTERELAQAYHRNLVERGAEPLFTAIGFGSHGAYPHARPGDRELRPGDVVRFDVGCTYENYSSDIARSFAFREADDDLARKYEVLAGSLDRGIDLLEPGATAAEVFDGTVGYVREEGADVFDSYDRNHVGHGIGIDVYDPPTLAPSDETIEAGMVFCVEPPYYELGTAGLQVEDEVVVTEDGAERLSECPGELRVLD